MADKKKVNESLELCLKGLCDICPYNGSNAPGGCKDELMYDTMILLKMQKSRLVIESDFNGADEYGYIPVWTEEKDGDMYWECIPKIAITDLDGIEVLRYWTSRPTDEQRKAIPWKT